MSPPPQSDKARGDIVKLSRIGVRYDRGPEILSDVDLALRAGSFTFLTGPSGVGKTSLLKLIYLGLKPSRGFVHIFGQDATTLSLDDKQVLKRRIGLVVQDYQLIDHLSIFENVALPLRIMGTARENYINDVTELLQWVGLGDRLNALPRTLSGGEKQRAAIARAIIAKPDLIIADEPTGNVDTDMGIRLLRLFMELNKSGTTVLIASHDKALIRAHATNQTQASKVTCDVFRLKRGRLYPGLAS